MKNVVSISNKLELVGFIRSIGTQCRFVTLTTETEVDMVKKHRITKIPNPFLGTIKIARRNGFLPRNRLLCFQLIRVFLIVNGYFLKSLY